jgi:hypothetical protein
MTRDVTLPRGTVLPVTLDTSIGSDIIRVEQLVQGHLLRAVIYHGVEVLPAGASVSGYVTSARRPGNVTGRGYVAVRFTQVSLPGEGRERISTAAIGREAPATKGKDAIEILAPATGGAIVGRLVGGKKGAGAGALIGGAAGTAYVLSTPGKDVRVGRAPPQVKSRAGDPPRPMNRAARNSASTAPPAHVPPAILPVERAATARELILCSGFPTQLVVATVMSTFGMHMRLQDGRLSPVFVFTLTLSDTLLLVGLIAFFFRAHGESLRAELFGDRTTWRDVGFGLLLIPASFALVVFVLSCCRR